MYNGYIYRVHPSFEDSYPSIRWSSHRNKPIDWVKLGSMFEGIIPLDEGFASDVDIHIVMGGRSVDVIDCELSLLVTTKARSCLEAVVADGIRFIPVKVNGNPWWCLVVDKKIDCLDWEQCDIEYLDELERKLPVIHKYVFRREYIVDPVLFNIADPKSFKIFTTESVKKTMLSAGLVGFEFVDFENPPEDYLMS